MFPAKELTLFLILEFVLFLTGSHSVALAGLLTHRDPPASTSRVLESKGLCN